MPSTRIDSPDATEPLPPPPRAFPAGAERVLWSEWRLVQDRYSALRGVTLEDRGGALRLRGRVPSHYLKQIALAAVSEFAGASPVVNEIEVVNHPRGAPTPRDAAPGADSPNH